MSEMGDSYDPGPWKGFDYKSARATYDNDAGRGYTGTSGSRKSTASRTIDSLVPEKLTTDARSPLVVLVDGTGSMGEFPKVMFEKLPLLDLGISDYLEDSEIAFSMIGDAGSDKYPLQVQPFKKGKELVTSLNSLIIEGGGGGNQQESYELGALYFARNVEMPKAVKPVLIYVCDEGIYPSVDKNWAEQYARVSIENSIKTKALFDELKNKYSVYCIRKHYNGGLDGEQMTGSNLAIHKQWEEYLGSDKIAILNDPRRVVDVIFGLLAYETGKQDFFKKELSHRQTPKQVAAVMKSMLTVGKDRKMLPPAGKSVLKTKNAKTKKVDDDK